MRKTMFVLTISSRSETNMDFVLGSCQGKLSIHDLHNHNIAICCIVCI